jgi:hypothetical protein
MSERNPPRTAAPPPSRAYKRSWKNLLINKKYQLRFTLFMAGLAGLLMLALGYFVMFYADRTTTIGINRVISEPCPAVSKVAKPRPALPVQAPPQPDRSPDPVDPTTGSGSGSGAGSADGSGSGRRSKVVMGESSIQTCDDPDPTNRPPDCPEVVPPPLGPPADEIAAHWACELRHAGAVAALHRGRTEILLVLVGTGLLLVLGLSIYGIKMTHKVAGPLYKVQLYLAKMKVGRYDKVWNLRKGDQLVEFYEHFKAGHAGVVAMEQADLARLKALLAVVDKDPAKFATPELAERVDELRAMVARKEKSFE